MLKLEGVIYCWRNKTNGKRYIGQTYREGRRKKDHLTEANKQYGVLNSFHTALREEGVDNFIYRVLFKCESEDKDELKRILNEKEQYYILKYKSFLTEFGYNETINGQYIKDPSNDAGNQNKKLRLKYRKRIKVIINGKVKRVTHIPEPKDVKEKRIQYESHAERLRNFCNALGVPMLSFELVKGSAKPIKE